MAKPEQAAELVSALLYSQKCFNISTFRCLWCVCTKHDGYALLGWIEQQRLFFHTIVRTFFPGENASPGLWPKIHHSFRQSFQQDILHSSWSEDSFAASAPDVTPSTPYLTKLVVNSGTEVPRRLCLHLHHQHRQNTSGTWHPHNLSLVKRHIMVEMNKKVVEFCSNWMRHPCCRAHCQKFLFIAHLPGKCSRLFDLSGNCQYGLKGNLNLIKLFPANANWHFHKWTSGSICFWLLSDFCSWWRIPMFLQCDFTLHLLDNLFLATEPVPVYQSPANCLQALSLSISRSIYSAPGKDLHIQISLLIFWRTLRKMCGCSLAGIHGQAQLKYAIWRVHNLRIAWNTSGFHHRNSAAESSAFGMVDRSWFQTICYFAQSGIRADRGTG